ATPRRQRFFTFGLCRGAALGPITSEGLNPPGHSPVIIRAIPRRGSRAGVQGGHSYRRTSGGKAEANVAK
ncbi:MAG: hypothetical protein ABR557_11320, partial [Pyrinomonadaceae bacterium]